MMLRIDRAAVWRSVPLRRGMTVLAVMPGAVALAGDLEWQMLTVLPGLVASGGALLFGVNTWCLDGRGALWRDSPAGRAPGRLRLPGGGADGGAALLGRPSPSCWPPCAPDDRPSRKLVALLCSTIVVVVQVVAAGMRWSIARPFAVDLRSARATPAPPVVMAGYSARLAVATTFTGLIFSGLAELERREVRRERSPWCSSAGRRWRLPEGRSAVGAIPVVRVPRRGHGRGLRIAAAGDRQIVAWSSV